VSGPGIQVRPALPSDLEAIARVQAESPEAVAWDPRECLHWICAVAANGDTVVGFLVARQLAADEREILNLAVAPAHRRQGVATTLLDTFLAGWKGTTWLEVRESNLGAQEFYRRYGFRYTGRRREYYQDTREDAAVFSLQTG